MNMNSKFLLFLLSTVLLVQQTTSITIITGGNSVPDINSKVPVICARYKPNLYYPVNEERTVTPHAQPNSAYYSSPQNTPVEIYPPNAQIEAIEGEEKITLIPEEVPSPKVTPKVDVLPTQQTPQEEQGYRFLISDPKFKDNEFKESVIFLFGKNFETTQNWGNAGLIMNKPLGIYASDIFVTFFGKNVLPSHLKNEVIYDGGPVQREMYNILVSIDINNRVLDKVDKSQWGLVGKNLYLMGIGPFRELVLLNNTYYGKTGKSLTKFWRMFSGYAMWGHGQLVNEINTPNVWIDYRTMSFPKSVLERLDKYKLYWHMVKLSENKKRQ